MSSCILTAGFGLPCRAVGGVGPAGVFISQWQCPGHTGAPIFGQTASGEITSLLSGTCSFFQFCQDLEVASLTETSVVSIENGTSYNEITLTFDIFGFNQSVQNIITTLGSGRWQVIVVGNDGNYYFLGLTNPVSITDGSGGLGKALGDLYGYTFTMTSKEQYGITQVDPAFVQSILVYSP